MIRRVLLYVRAGPCGRVIVAPVDFPGLACDAADFERAVAVLRPAILAAVAELDAFERTSFEEEPRAEFLTVPVEVKLRGQDSSVAIGLGVVASSRSVQGRPVTLVRALALP